MQTKFQISPRHAIQALRSRTVGRNKLLQMLKHMPRVGGTYDAKDSAKTNLSKDWLFEMHGAENISVNETPNVGNELKCFIARGSGR